jgi:hypothetical protein
MLTQTVPYMVQSTPSGNGHNGNGRKEETSTEVVVKPSVEVRVHYRAAEIPDYNVRLAKIAAVLDYTARVRGAFRPELTSISRDFAARPRLGVVLFNQAAAALVQLHAEPLQVLTGIAMPGVWPEPDPVPTRVEVIDGPAVETVRQLREVFNGYGNCPAQLQHKVSAATRLLNRGSS